MPQEICDKAINVVKDTANFILEQLGQVKPEQISDKSSNNFVSFVDKESERRLIAGLGAIVPDAAFLAEEGTVALEDKPYLWIIDPLDGTTNFLHQIPVFAISVALYHNGEPIVGIVHDVMRNECFHAWADGPAMLNDREISCSATTEIHDCLLVTGFPYDDFSRVGAYLGMMEYCMRNTRGIRRLGSAAIDLAWVAAGRSDGFFEYSLAPWDVAGGAFIVMRAGGHVSDFKGGSQYLHGREILATTAHMHTKLLEVTRSYFG